MRRAHRHGPSPRLYLTPRHKVAIYGTLATLWASGALWLVFHYFLPQHGPFGDQPNPAEHWLIAVHGAAAFATLWLGGWMWHAHVRPWRRSGTRRRSGNVLLYLGGLLIVSGFLLYYATGDDLRRWISITHWSVGVLLAVAVLMHLARSGRYRVPD